MKILAENEVAHAGIGVDVGVNGLASLIKTSDFMEKLRQNAERLHNMTANITTHVDGQDTLNNTYRKVEKLNHGATSHIHFESTGQQNINDEIDKFRHQIDKNVHFELLGTDYLNHEVEYLDKPAYKDIKFNVDTGAIDQVHTSFNKVDNDADKARNKTLSLAEAGKKVHGVFAGSFLGNAMSNAFSSITNGAKSAIASGVKLAETGDEVRESWQHIGVGNNNSNQMVGQMDKLRDMAGLDEQSIQRMQKSFYTLTGSAPQARSLVNEVSAFGKASGESNQEIARMGTMLPRMLSTGKVRAQMFNRTFGQSGELVNALAKASGNSAKSFRALVDSGKLTSQQLQQYMQKAAKGSSHAWAQYDRTFRGQMQTIKGSVTEAKEDFAKPFVNNLTKSLNQTEKSGTGLQKVQGSIHQITTELGKRVGVFAGKAIGYIVKNQHALFKTGSALFRIVGELASGAWKTVTFPLRVIDNLFNLMAGRSMKAHHGLVTTGNVLTWVANHRKSVEALGGAMATAFAAWKFMKFAVAIHKVYSAFKALSIIQSIVSMVKGWTTAQATLDAVLDANPIGAVVVGITAAIAAIAGVVAGLHHLYVHCVPARHAMQAIGHAGVAAFKLITLPERMVLKLLGGIVKGVWNATSGLRHKLAGAFDDVKKHAESFYNSALHNSNKWGHEFGSWVTGNGWKYRHNQMANAHAAEISHHKIDSFRKNSSGKFRAYIARDGKIYRSYHRGTTRISETTYKQREAIRSRYYRKYTSSLRKYEANYKKYESKRSSLSRKYGKLRAMYSERSLKTIENRFKGLRNTVVRYAKMMFRDTQHIFRRLGSGASKQFLKIYRYVRKYLRMSNREAKSDFRALYRTSRRYLNGSIKKYVSELHYRYKKQRYYDNQLVKQAKKTAVSMYKLPLGWITRETKDLIRNWQHQRKSYITHNTRMSHAELVHLQTMTSHLREFGDKFQKMMTDLESNIYDAWCKFWDKMHNAAGSGINSVQAPLNSGAEHINSFVRSFGETSSPMSTMPEVSYATGTGMRRPITHMVQATLNDGHDSPETHEQETVIHPNGAVEFPQGLNTKATLEPGAEVLNATETKLLGQMANFSPTVHFATGTGIFGDLFNQMSGWIKSALNGTNNSDDYSSLWGQAKGSGKTKLLHVLQSILKNSNNVIAGFMGNAPTRPKGVFHDITQGIYGQTSNQINKWWQVLMKLSDQALNNGASSSEILNYAIKHWTGVPYVYGATANSGADCGGAVQSILRHFNINVPHVDIEDSPAVRYVGKSESDARPGDLVGFGSKSGSKSGASSHIGIYEGHGQMWSEHPPKSGPESIAEAAAADGLWGYYRIKGAPQNNNSLSSIKTNNPLGNFVKRQEAPMLKWIEKNLAPLLNPDPGAGPGVAKWRTVIEQAAEKMHVHLTESGLQKVMSNIQHESGGDEAVTQKISDINSAEGDPAIGLVQFIPPTFNHYAVPGHNNIRSGYDQLLALFNDSNWYSDIAPGGGWGPSGSRRMQAGGHIEAGDVATVGEQGEELFKPDTSGTIIPHDTTKRILNHNDNSKPVTVKQTINVTANGNSSKIKQLVKSGVDKGTDDLMDKLARMSGLNDDGGLIV